MKHTFALMDADPADHIMGPSRDTRTPTLVRTKTTKGKLASTPKRQADLGRGEVDGRTFFCQGRDMDIIGGRPC